MEDSLFTKEALSKIEECLISGARTISINEKSITFHSLDELLKLRNQIRRFLTGGSGIKTTVPIITKGFYNDDLR